MVKNIFPKKILSQYSRYQKSFNTIKQAKLVLYKNQLINDNNYQLDLLIFKGDSHGKLAADNDTR